MKLGDVGEFVNVDCCFEYGMVIVEIDEIVILNDNLLGNFL